MTDLGAGPPDPARPGRPDRRLLRTFLVPAGAGIAYGLVCRLLFGGPFLAGKAMVTVGFLLLVPAAMGVIVARLVPGHRMGPALALTALSVFGLMIGTLVTALEGAICVVMMAPVALIVALSTCMITTALSSRASDRATLAVMVLPFVVAAIERRIGAEPEIRTIETETTIRAPAGVVWANVVRVPAIRDEEREPTFFHRIGFPRPVEATIDGRGVGAVRHASFERGAVFREAVTFWDDGRELAFEIAPESMPPTAFDEHVVPGGAEFSTLEGRYRLEPRADGTVVLHLTSRSRLSTTINWYARPWVDAAMRSIQDDILRIVRARCERGEVPR